MSVFTVILLDCVTEKRSKAMEEKFFLLLYDCSSPPRGSEKTHFCMKPFSRPWAVILHFCSGAKSSHSWQLRGSKGSREHPIMTLCIYFHSPFVLTLFYYLTDKQREQLIRSTEFSTLFQSFF